MYNQIILEKLNPILECYNLRVFEQFENYLQLRSEKLVIVIAYDKRDHSNALFVGKNEEKLALDEISDHVLKQFFGSDLKLEQVSQDVFLNNIMSFFENEGKPLFSKDLMKLNELQRFSEQRAKEYTKEILDRQILIAADNAWNNGNLPVFFDLID